MNRLAYLCITVSYFKWASKSKKYRPFVLISKKSLIFFHGSNLKRKLKYMQDKLCQHAALYTVNDWVRGQQQFCLTRERICCPKPHAEDNISVLGSNKTAELSEKPVYRCFVIHHYFFQHFLIHSFHSPSSLAKGFWSAPLQKKTVRIKNPWLAKMSTHLSIWWLQ